MLTRLLSRVFHTSVERMNPQEIPKALPKYTYGQLKEALKREDAVVIDVREQEELKETSEIPGSINIPVGNVEQAFVQLDKEHFKNEFGRDKPGKDTEIVVSCLSGKRSLFIQKILLGLGYQKVYNYEGGWLEWNKNQKKE